MLLVLLLPPPPPLLPLPAELTSAPLVTADEIVTTVGTPLATGPAADETLITWRPEVLLVALVPVLLLVALIPLLPPAAAAAAAAAAWMNLMLFALFTTTVCVPVSKRLVCCCCCCDCCCCCCWVVRILTVGMRCTVCPLLFKIVVVVPCRLLPACWL
uniref:Uncharacterized protein n=1 Tax=Anopheles triannulatus TaxID=58253 RepID=A0A2M4AU41_9DIPT